MRQFGSIRKLESGRWQARYWDDAYGKQRSAPNTFKTRGDASRWLAALESGQTSIDHIVQSKTDTRLDDYAKRWIDQRDLKPRTTELYASQYRLHISPYLGEIKIARIQSEHIRSWHHQLSSTNLMQPTVAKVYRLLRSILNTAVEDRLLPTNPCLIKNAGVERSKERDIPTMTEFKQLAYAMPDYLQAAIWIAALAGLRKGEILGLARKHIDLDCSQLRVERALQEITGQGAVLGETKTYRSVRTVAIPTTLVQVLGSHLHDHVGSEPDSLLFTNSRNSPIRSSVWAPAWARAQEHTGLSEVRLHDLRHLSGTLIAIAGATLKETMNHLGHATPQAALRYQHIANGRMQELATKLDEIID